MYKQIGMVLLLSCTGAMWGADGAKEIRSCTFNGKHESEELRDCPLMLLPNFAQAPSDVVKIIHQKIKPYDKKTLLVIRACNKETASASEFVFSVSKLSFDLATVFDAEKKEDIFKNKTSQVVQQLLLKGELRIQGSINLNLSELKRNFFLNTTAHIGFRLFLNAAITQEKLTLPNNKFDIEDMYILLPVLQRNTSITELDLSDNSFGDAGLRQLMPNLKYNTKLITLKLNANNITPCGAAVIKEALQHNTTLKNLCLNDNSIGSHYGGSHVIADILRSSTTLQRLELGKNSFNGQDAFAIIWALQCNTSLTFLNLGGNLSDYLSSMINEMKGLDQRNIVMW